MQTFFFSSICPELLLYLFGLQSLYFGLSNVTKTKTKRKTQMKQVKKLWWCDDFLLSVFHPSSFCSRYLCTTFLDCLFFLLSNRVSFRTFLIDDGVPRRNVLTIQFPVCLSDFLTHFFWVFSLGFWFSNNWQPEIKALHLRSYLVPFPIIQYFESKYFFSSKNLF